MKIECLTCIWLFVYAMIFEPPEMAKNKILDFFVAFSPPLEFVFQEQSYSSLHSGWSLS